LLNYIKIRSRKIIYSSYTLKLAVMTGNPPKKKEEKKKFGATKSNPC